MHEIQNSNSDTRFCVYTYAIVCKGVCVYVRVCTYVWMDVFCVCIERECKQNNEGKKKNTNIPKVFSPYHVQFIFVYFLVLPIVVLASSSDTNPTRTIA